MTGDRNPNIIRIGFQRERISRELRSRNTPSDKSNDSSTDVRVIGRRAARPGVGAVRPKEEYQGMQKDGEEFRFDFWIQMMSGGWRPTKRNSSFLLARRPPAFHCRMLGVSVEGGLAGGGTKGNDCRKENSNVLGNSDAEKR